MNTREKNLANIQKQEEVQAKEEKQMNSEMQNPTSLRKQLTNKNGDYVFRLEKALIDAGKSSAEAEKMVNALLNEIVTAQKQGIPASSLYKKSPILKAEEILHPVIKPKKPKYWMRAVDSSLLYFVVFTAMIAIMALTAGTKNQYNSQYGLLTLIAIAAILGTLMTYYTDILVADGKGKAKFGKIALLTVAMVAVLFIVITIFSSKVFQVINPVLPAWGNLILVALVYGARYLFRKHYHITGSVLNPVPQVKSRD